VIILTATSLHITADGPSERRFKIGQCRVRRNTASDRRMTRTDASNPNSNHNPTPTPTLGVGTTSWLVRCVGLPWCRGPMRHFVDVPLSSRSGTSLPRRPSHHILRRRFSASSAFRKPTPAHRTSLSAQHIRPSGIFDRWSDGLELAAWRTQRSGVRFWQF